MRPTSFTDHGLRTLMRPAGEPGRGRSTAEMAEEFGLSRHHLGKVVQRLVQGGLLVTRRGGGGAMPAQAAAEIRLGEVVGLLERDRSLVARLAAGGRCSLTRQRRLRQRLRAAKSAFLHDLDGSTLAEIALPGPGGVHQ